MKSADLASCLVFQALALLLQTVYARLTLFHRVYFLVVSSVPWQATSSQLPHPLPRRIHTETRSSLYFLYFPSYELFLLSL